MLQEPDSKIYYRYLPASFAYESLLLGHLKVGNVKDFNDPFEAYPAVEKQEFARKSGCDSNLLPETVFKLADELFKVISFSLPDNSKTATQIAKDEILMWSHYGDNHQGVRIGFDFTGSPYADHVKEVKYKEFRPAADTEVTKSRQNKNPEQDLMVKSAAWKYENEYRLILLDLLPFIKKSLSLGSVEIDVFEFCQSWVKKIEFGLKCPLIWQRRFERLKTDKYPNAELRKAVRHATEYRLTYEACKTYHFTIHNST